MKRNILFFFLAALCSCALAQNLGEMIRRAADFDNRYPRETVYLHLDNASYIQGDTLWYKAFVVRASTLRPDATLSRTLYVELLNDAGTMLQRSVLRLDSLGQAHGNFALTQPLQRGFYEIRAYTRAMTNWSSSPALPNQREGAGYFSRVFPLFELPKKATPGDFTQLDIQHPEDEQYFTLKPERPYQFGRKGKRNVEWFPEGGQRIEGTAQRVAYRLTDGNGAPVEDTLTVCLPNGTTLVRSVPQHLGMGSFVLPAGAGDGLYAVVSGAKEKHPLPVPREDGVAMFVDTAEDVFEVTLQAGAALLQPDEDGDVVPLDVALVVINREHPYRVFPLQLDGEAIAQEIALKDLRAGVNRLEVVDAEGRSLASRLVFVHADRTASALPGAVVNVKQSQTSYDPFSPIAVEVEVKDEAGRPLPMTELSLSVRDDDGELVGDNSASLHTQLLLSSEVKGYVHQPEWYFADNDAHRAAALDLLMMTQGWTAEHWDLLCQTKAFDVRQPVEERRPILRGKVIRDKEKIVPYANINLHLTMYNDKGLVMRSEARTDSVGRFAFEATEDYFDRWTGQFTMQTDKGSHPWSRVMLDQWFAPQPRPYQPLEYVLMQPVSPYANAESNEVQQKQAPKVDTFVWADTITSQRHFLLHEAEVKAKTIKRYKGLNFNRYTYGGGEAQGARHSDTYINVDLELQRSWDQGLDLYNIRNFLNYVMGDVGNRQNPDVSLSKVDGEMTTMHAPVLSSFGNGIETRLEGKDESQKGDPEDKVRIHDNVGNVYFYDKRDYHDDMDLQLLDQRLPTEIIVGSKRFVVDVNNHAGIPEGQYEMSCPEQIKSILVSYDKTWAQKVASLESKQPVDTHYDGIIYLYTREDWYKFKRKKGVHKRNLYGFTTPTKFTFPNYRQMASDNPNDFRRTLYWNPNLKTDVNGRASAVFFSNARENQHLRITVRGITADGRLIEYDR